MLSHLRVTGALSQEMIKHYAKGDVTDDLYQLACEKAYTVKQASHQNCAHQWHRRMRHRNPEAVLKLSQQKLADGIHIEPCGSLLKCISCIKGKWQDNHFQRIAATELSKY